MKVAIFFGSKSDKDTMKKAADVLTEFGVDYKAYIISAHRAGALLKQTVEEVEKTDVRLLLPALVLQLHSLELLRELQHFL